MEDSDTVRSQVRLSPALHARIVDAARTYGRSMNAEIVHRLEASFDATTTSRELAEAGRKLDEHLEKMMAMFQAMAENPDDPVSVAARRAVRETLQKSEGSE